MEKKIDYSKEDLSIQFRVNIPDHRVRCRAKFCGDHIIKRGAPYIMIHGWGAGGMSHLCTCLKHADPFLKQMEEVQKQIKEFKNRPPELCKKCGGAIYGTGKVESCGYPLCECE